MLLRPGDLIEEVVIVKTGCLEILLRIDSVDFVMGRLEAGSIFNSQSIFQLYSTMYCTIRCCSAATVQTLKGKQLDKIALAEKKFS